MPQDLHPSHTTAAAPAGHPNDPDLPSPAQQDMARALAGAMESILKMRHPELAPRVLAYPLRRRVQLAWDHPDGSIRTHWLAWTDANPPGAAYRDRQLIEHADTVIIGSVRNFSSARH